MARKEIKFTDIVQMIIDDAVPEGATFLTPAVEGSSALITAEVSAGALRWADTIGDSKAVTLSRSVINDTWYIEVPEVELSLQEAIAEWKAGNNVEIEHNGQREIIGKRISLDTIWDETDIYDLDDLLFKSKFYKVAA